MPGKVLGIDRDRAAVPSYRTSASACCCCAAGPRPTTARLGLYLAFGSCSILIVSDPRPSLEMDFLRRIEDDIRNLGVETKRSFSSFGAQCFFFFFFLLFFVLKKIPG